MKSTSKFIVLLAAIFAFSINKSWGQSVHPITLYCSTYIFDADSLAGFDENAARLSTISEGFVGSEYKVHMFSLKRQYINAKYNIQPSKPVHNLSHKIAATTAAAPACNNEDFEASTPGGIFAANQIAGWTISGGNVNPPNNACNLNGCCLNAPSQSQLIDCPAATGFIDPVIGGVYPIYSVFGDGGNNGNANNPQIPIPMGGTKIIRINNHVQNYSVEKLSKTFAVTPDNALFQFAFASIFSTGHGCCDASTFKIILTNANANTVIPCPNFSVGAPSTQCSTNTPMPYYLVPSGNPYAGSGSLVFSKWNINSLDLTAYIGGNITIDVIVTDCTAGGHYGTVYFDAQCSPMVVIGNGTGYPAGTPSITLPTCGAAGATVVAPSGMGPYSWSSGQISIPPNLTASHYTNTTLLTNQSGTVQLTMNPPGSCQPIVKVITVTITPAPIVVGSATQSSCTNSLSVASITCAGSASVSPTITWEPAPGVVAGNSLSAAGLAVGVTTITVLDPLGCKATTTLNILPAPPPVTFTINNLTGSYSITCINPTINLQAITNYTYGTVSYTWSSPSYTSNSESVGISAANTLTIVGVDHATGCLHQEVVTVDIFTTTPTNTVNPQSQVVTCNSQSPVTFTGTVTNPTVNIQHDWYSPMNPLPWGVPIATSNNTISVLSGAIPPGIYTLQTTNLVNGCQSFKTVTVTSLDAYPTFNILSSTNFSVGCSPLNTTTIIINNAQSTQTPPSVCSYTFLPPGFAGVVTESIVLGNNSSFVTTIPGTWTVIVQDNSNWCRAKISIPIIQNTVAPNISANMSTQTLTCKNPTVIGTGLTTTPNTEITWLVPATPPMLSTPTLVIGPENGPNTSTTSLTYANYTVIVTNTVNACQSSSVVVINQNFKPPVTTPTISIGTPTAIYCTAGSNPVILTTGSSTVTSGEPFAFVSNPTWEGPSPQASFTGPSTYSCYVPGIYSLTLMDSYNGCLKTGTINVLDRTQPPVITNPRATATLDCGSNLATMTIVLTGTSTGGVRYLMHEYPSGAAFTPTAAPIFNLDPLLSGTTSSVIVVSKIGEYDYVVSNTLTGCQAEGIVVVTGGDLIADFQPNPATGFAPLTVNFNNTSRSSLGTGSITSVWGFGNGNTQTTSSNISTSATFNSPGTYTVVLVTSKGSCLDTAYQIIRVDIPSKFEVPNVFTPNGDGSNDVFFLKVANLSEVTAVILDRWGNKVYETTSSSGNIAWDGKNFQGKDCPTGVYFYVIKATGKDEKAYEQKGTVSLYR